MPGYIFRLRPLNRIKIRKVQPGVNGLIMEVVKRDCFWYKVLLFLNFSASPFSIVFPQYGPPSTIVHDRKILGKLH